MPEYRDKNGDEKMEAFNDRTKRIDFPYVLEYEQEAMISRTMLRNADQPDIQVEPHTLEMAGLFGILTRIGEPDTGTIDLVQKAKVYNGEIDDAEDVETYCRYLELVREEYKERAIEDVRHELAYDVDEIQRQGEKYTDHVMAYIDDDTVEDTIMGREQELQTSTGALIRLAPDGTRMRTPLGDIDVGDRLSQADIEEAFATDFGYRISGINPRRDANGDRYVLVFATEDGPYDDTVTAGRFEYISEGLEGDQSTSSPGNAALIDAIEADMPVHFFYQRAGETEWEYQGRVPVQDYDFRTQDGREVIVFTMAHRDTPGGSVIQPADDVSWLEAMRRELDRYRKQTGNTIVTLDELYAFAEHRLAAQFPGNEHVRAKIRQQLQLEPLDVDSETEQAVTDWHYWDNRGYMF